MNWDDVVRDFGVLNDGTIQSAQIRQAINYARENNKSLYFPAGKYYGAFEFFSDMHIFGEGSRTVIKPYEEVYKSLGSVGAFGTESEPLKNITLENLTFDTEGGRVKTTIRIRQQPKY